MPRMTTVYVRFEYELIKRYEGFREVTVIDDGDSQQAAVEAFENENPAETIEHSDKHKEILSETEIIYKGCEFKNVSTIVK